MTNDNQKRMDGIRNFFDKMEAHRPRRPRKTNKTLGIFRGTPPKIQKPRKKR